jgi:hypothetical protein
VLAGMGQEKVQSGNIQAFSVYGIFVTTLNGISFAWLSEGIQILQSA